MHHISACEGFERANNRLIPIWQRSWRTRLQFDFALTLITPPPDVELAAPQWRRTTMTSPATWPRTLSSRSWPLFSYLSLSRLCSVRTISPDQLDTNSCRKTKGNASRMSMRAMYTVAHAGRQDGGNPVHQKVRDLRDRQRVLKWRVDI